MGEGKVCEGGRKQNKENASITLIANTQGYCFVYMRVYCGIARVELWNSWTDEGIEAGEGRQKSKGKTNQ